jgi:hypothetical protein
MQTNLGGTKHFENEKVDIMSKVKFIYLFALGL